MLTAGDFAVIGDTKMDLGNTEMGLGNMKMDFSTVAGVTPNIEWARQLFLEIERLASSQPDPRHMERIKAWAGIGSHLLEDIGDDLAEIEERYEMAI